MAQAQRKESRIERPCGYAYPLWDRGRATGLERTSTQNWRWVSRNQLWTSDGQR